MKVILATLLAAGTIAGSSAGTQSRLASPLLGSWKVDVSRLPVPPEARPKSVTITFSDVGRGKWSTHVDIYGGDGSQRHMVSSYALDGTAAPIQGDTSEADTGAVRIPTPNVMVLALGKGGGPASTRIYTVGSGANTMIETAVSFGDDGQPVMRTNYFSRVR